MINDGKRTAHSSVLPAMYITAVLSQLNTTGLLKYSHPKIVERIKLPE